MLVATVSVAPLSVRRLMVHSHAVGSLLVSGAGGFWRTVWLLFSILMYPVLNEVPVCWPTE